MKKRIAQSAKKYGWFAFGMLAFIVTMLILIAPVAGIGITCAAGLVVGGVELTEKEAAVYNGLMEELKSVTGKFEKGYISETKASELIKAATDQFNMKAGPEDIKALKDALEAQGLELQKMKQVEKEVQYKSIYDQVYDQLKANPEKLKDWASKKAQFDISINLKQVDNYTTSDVTNVTNVYQTMLDTVIKPLALEGILFKNPANCRVFPTTSPQLVYIDEGTPEGAPTVVGEGSGKPQIDTHYTATPITPHKFAAYIKISEEMLMDLAFIASEITNNLITRLEATTDSLIATTGTWGFEAIAPAYSSTTLNGVINIGDSDGVAEAIQAMANQIRENHYTPNLVVVTPAIYSQLLLRKDDDNHSDSVVAWGADGISRIWGMRLIQSTVLEAGHIAVGDFSKVNVGIYQNVTVEMGWETADFINNMRTIRAEQRLYFYSTTQERKAICYDAYATVVTAIDSGS
jgi:HK97 family phage major capsid protein